MLPASHSLAVLEHPSFPEKSAQIAAQLSLPLVSGALEQLEHPFVLVADEFGLAQHQNRHHPPRPVRVDFASGAQAHRRSQGGGELIVKAVVGNNKFRPRVLDATAGLGRDSFVLACKGFEMTLCERSPVVAALLADGLERAHADEKLQPVAVRMRLFQGDAKAYLNGLGADAYPDVVLIDPMFPASGKSAQVKKDMQAFQAVVGADQDSDELLEVALSVARYRVVVKRPRKGPALPGRTASFAITGKAIRFDVYALRAFPK